MEIAPSNFALVTTCSREEVPLIRPTCRGVEFAETFKDPSVVAAHRHRPPHSPRTFELLRELIVDRPRSLLDAGTGLGDLARELAPDCDRVDAVDFSRGMIETARSLHGGGDPRIRWVRSPIEEADLIGPYTLITAADSLSWFDLNVVILRFARLLTENGVLAVVDRGAHVGLREGDIIPRYSLNREYVGWDPVTTLEEMGLFERLGQEDTGPVPWTPTVVEGPVPWTPTVVEGPVPWTPTVVEYIERRHSQNGFSRDRMSRRQAADFDAATRARIAEQVSEGSVQMEDGRLQGQVVGSVVWASRSVRPTDAREKGIAETSDAGARGSLDHLIHREGAQANGGTRVALRQQAALARLRAVGLRVSITR